jgi:mRNA degradation ribonuclease J1/J2
MMMMMMWSTTCRKNESFWWYINTVRPNQKNRHHRERQYNMDAAAQLSRNHLDRVNRFVAAANALQREAATLREDAEKIHQLIHTLSLAPATHTRPAVQQQQHSAADGTIYYAILGVDSYTSRKVLPLLRQALGAKWRFAPADEDHSNVALFIYDGG